MDRHDAGEYTCIAENNAGRIESSAVFSVVIKPHIQELFNKTFPIGQESASLTCKASGDPLPKIIWRKWSQNEPYIIGQQPEDPRIWVEEREVGSYCPVLLLRRPQVEAPEYTEGEKTWRENVLTIQGVNR